VERVQGKIAGGGDWEEKVFELGSGPDFLRGMGSGDRAAGTEEVRLRNFIEVGWGFAVSQPVSLGTGTLHRGRESSYRSAPLHHAWAQRRLGMHGQIEVHI